MDTLVWIKSRLDSGSDELILKEFEPAFAFLLVWGLFEGRLFKDENRLSIDALIKLAKSNKCDAEKSRVCEIYEVFVSRYFGPSRVRDAFDNLRFEKVRGNFLAIIK